MTRQHHYDGLNHLLFLTSSTYRRARFFDSERFRRRFVSDVDGVRTDLGFRLIGYVLMPEYFHLLIWPSELANPSQILQSLKERTSKFIPNSLLKKSILSC
ncbi:MAG: transposase [Terriglobia bacterium]